MKQIKVKLTFTEGILGTSPGNEDIYREYIAGKAPDAASIEEELRHWVRRRLPRRLRRYSRARTRGYLLFMITRSRDTSRTPAAAFAR